jgi:hypothetical protein
LYGIANALRSIPHDADWTEFLNESIHAIRINLEAELTLQPTFSFLAFNFFFSCAAQAAHDETRCAQLLASPSLVEGLLFGSRASFNFMSTSVASVAAVAAVSLIGKNEGGLTLSEHAIGSTLDNFQEYFDESNRRSTYSAGRAYMVAKAVSTSEWAFPVDIPSKRTIYPWITMAIQG